MFFKAALTDSSLALGSASVGVMSRSSADNGWIVQASLRFVDEQEEKEIGRSRWSLWRGLHSGRLG